MWRTDIARAASWVKYPGVHGCTQAGLGMLPGGSESLRGTDTLFCFRKCTISISELLRSWVSLLHPLAWPQWVPCARSLGGEVKQVGHLGDLPERESMAQGHMVRNEGPRT